MKADHERDTVIAICKELTRLRLEKEISQQRLAEIADISRTGLRHVESLKYNPTLFTLLKIAKALNVNFSEILSRHQNEQQKR